MLRRREFLGSTLAGLALGTRDAGPKKPAAVPLAFSLYGMRTLKLEDALARCAKIGYDAVELATMPDWPADPARLGKAERAALRRRLTDLNLALPALMADLPFQADDKMHRVHLDRLEAAIELGHALAAEAPLIETIVGGAVGAWEKLRRMFADRLGDWARVGEKTRTVIAIKPHRLGAMNLPEHALWLLDQVRSRWIKLAYDYSHFQFRDLTMEATLKAMLPSTAFVHVKDVRVDGGAVRFLLPGEGKIDYIELLTRLRHGKYAGCVCVEVSGQISREKDYDPEGAARRSYDNLMPAFRKAGLR